MDRRRFGDARGPRGPGRARRALVARRTRAVPPLPLTGTRAVVATAKRCVGTAKDAARAMRHWGSAAPAAGTSNRSLPSRPLRVKGSQKEIGEQGVARRHGILIEVGDAGLAQHLVVD